MALVITVGVIVGVKQSRDGEAAVIIRAEDGITIVEMVEIHSHNSIRVKIETHHHVFTALVNASEIVRKYMIANAGVYVGNLVEFTFEFREAVGLGAAHALPVNRDIAICRREVLIALLTPFKPFIEDIWQLSAILIGLVEVIVIRVAALKVCEPCRGRVFDGAILIEGGVFGGKHIIHAVDTLKPIHRIVGFQLIVFNRVYHIPGNMPFAAGIGHCSRGFSPCSVDKSENLMERATKLTQHIDVRIAIAVGFSPFCLVY